MQQPSNRFYRSMIATALVLLSVSIFLAILRFNHANAHQFAPYRTEIAVASLVAQMPATAIPARDRPIIAMMRTGKRVTNDQIYSLGSGIYPYFRARRKAMSVRAQDSYVACHKQALVWLFRTHRSENTHAS